MYEVDAQLERCWGEMDALLSQAQCSVVRLESFARVFHKSAGMDVVDSQTSSALAAQGFLANYANDNQCGNPSPTSLPKDAVHDSALDGKILKALTDLRDALHEDIPNRFATNRPEEQEQQILAEQYTATPQVRRQYMRGGVPEESFANDSMNLLQVQQRLEHLLAQRSAPKAAAAPGPQAMQLGQEEFEQAPNGLPSIGSAGHFSKSCKPCVFLYNGMCLKGMRCQFCHISHDSDAYKRVRPSKRTRNLLRQHATQGLGPEDSVSNPAWQ